MTFTFGHGDRPLDDYTIQRGVGRGGFGEVYYALSDGGKEVALKYLRDNPQVELRGVDHCMNLKSPYLVTVYDVRQNEKGEYFIVMEYIAGPSLRDLLLAEDKGLGAQKAAFFLREIGKGLGYLHDRGIVHRDLKPGNIFYEDGYVKIGDYGLSKCISVSQHSAQTASVGTVHYMAPEVGTGNYHRGIDIYALGVILYEMLLGRVPFEGSSMGEVLMKHLMAQPEVAELPAPFGEVITKALAKEPAERYQSVDEMTAAVFGAEDIRNSVARFEPTSVTMAAQRVHVGARVPPRVIVPGAGSSRIEPLGGGVAVSEPTPRLGSTDRGRSTGLVDHMRRGMEVAETQFHRLEGTRPGVPPAFPQRSRWVAGLLGIFLGWVGAHRFYLGFRRVGVIQIAATIFTSGVAYVWGFTEGVLLLCGWGTDVYGRPLLTHRPDSRFIGFRVLWGLLALCAFLGAVPMAIVPAFETAIERISGPQGEYAVDLMKLFYPGAISLVGLGVFAAWKAAHRPGLSLWRATLRPLTMWLCWGIIVWAAAMDELFYLPGEARTALAVVMFGAGAAWLFVWIARGADPPPRPGQVASEWYLGFGMLLAMLGCFAAALYLANPKTDWPHDFEAAVEALIEFDKATSLLFGLAWIFAIGGVCCWGEALQHFGRAKGLMRAERALKAKRDAPDR